MGTNGELVGSATDSRPSHTTRIALAVVIPAALIVLALGVTLVVLVRSREDGPHLIPADERPALVNPNGTVSAALAPKVLPVVGPDGKAVCNADGSRVMVPLDTQARTTSPPVSSADGNAQVVRPYDAGTTHSCDASLTATP